MGMQSIWGEAEQHVLGLGIRFYLCVQQQWLKQLHLPWFCREKWVSGSEGVLPLLPGLATHTGPSAGHSRTSRRYCRILHLFDVPPCTEENLGHHVKFLQVTEYTNCLTGLVIPYNLPQPFKLAISFLVLSLVLGNEAPRHECPKSFSSDKYLHLIWEQKPCNQDSLFSPQGHFGQPIFYCSALTPSPLLPLPVALRMLRSARAGGAELPSLHTPRAGDALRMPAWGCQCLGISCPLPPSAHAPSEVV